MHIFSISFSIYYDPNIKFLQRTQKFNLKNSRFWWILGHKQDKNGQTLNFVKNNNLVYHLIGNFMPINVCKGFFCENQYFVQKWPLFVVFFSRKRGQMVKILTQVFSCEFAKFLRKPILKNICERVLLQINQGVLKSPKDNHNSRKAL